MLANLLRRAAFSVPFGCLTALAAHDVRFGDDHAFGGEANTAIVSGAIGGSIAIAVMILYAFLTAGSTTVTGTIARARVSALLPRTGAVLGVAAAFYYGIETLEGNGVELGLPTLLLAVIAWLVASASRALCAQLATFAVAIVRDLVALASARPCVVARTMRQRHVLRAQTLLTARRLGRAPPNERRFS
jgi:hypothetical protein